MIKHTVKSAIAITLVLVMTTAIFVSSLITTVSMNIPHEISFNNPAIPANVGDTVDLSTYSVEFSEGSVASSGISWSSSEITIANNKVTPTQKGVYKMIAKWGANTKNIYLVVKNTNESEYVLYYDDFSNSSTLSNYTYATGKCSIANGKLTLNAADSEFGETDLVLPEWLGEFGNYSITTNATITQTYNNISRRWMSIVYRAQNFTDSFAQMCIRQNASSTSGDGVELSYKIPEKSWSYHAKGSYTADLSTSRYYTFELNVFKQNVSVSIDGNDCINATNVVEHEVGKIGFKASGSVASFDDIKVTARFSIEGMAIPRITLAPSMIYEIKDKTSLDNILTTPPAVAIMTIDQNGDIVDADEKVICTAQTAKAKLGSDVIPAFKLSSKCSANKAISLINGLQLKEAMFISSLASDISIVRSQNPSIIGILDYSNKDLSDKKFVDIRSETLSSRAKICILPASIATSKNTEFLNTTGVTVWYQAEKNTELEMFNLITAGSNGIVTLDRDLMTKCLDSEVFLDNSIIRPVGVIGHRGTPALAPENTIAGSALAAMNGANIIENDIYITTDGVIVVMHNDTIDATTDGSGNVESFTYEQLKQYSVDVIPTPSDPSFGCVSTKQPIPTLEEYFQTFKGTDTFMFIEIKSGQSEKIAKALKELIDKYDIADQCCVITFGRASINAVRTYIPEISVGFLCGSDQFNPHNVENIMSNTSALDSSYNPSSNFVNKNLVKDLSTRGVFTWPWTIRDSVSFDTFYIMGVAGITTDNSYFAKDYVKRLTVDKSQINLEKGECESINVLAETYGAEDGTQYENFTYITKRAEMAIVSGNQSVKYSNGKISATEDGDAIAIFRLEYKLNNGTSVHVYSQPVLIQIGADADTAPDNSASDNKEPNDPPNESETQAPKSEITETDTQAATDSTKKKGCASSLSTTAISITAILGAALLIKKKED